MKKLLSFILVLAFILSISCATFAAETSTTLDDVNARLAKLEEKLAKQEAKSKFSIESETLFQYVTDSPPAGFNKLKGSNSFQWRERLYFNGAVNENTTLDARLQTGISTFGTNTNGNTVQIDRIYFTTKNALGADKIVWGRQPILFGQGFLSWKTGNNDGITIFKKLSNSTDFQAGAYTVNPATGTSGDSQELQYASVGFKPNANLKLNAAYYNSNQTLNSSGLDASFVQKIGKYTFLGEYVRSDLDSSAANNSPNAYSLAITNGSNLPQYFYPVQRFLVDYKKPHTDAFELQYRSVEKNALPTGFGSPNGTGNGVSLDSSIVGPGIANNSKGFFFIYENVIAKGMVMSLEYQNLKHKDTGTDFDKIFRATLQVVI